MKDVNFYKLSRPVQERFVGSVSGQFAPVPILSARGGTAAPLIWLAVSAGASIALVVVYRVGLGNLESSHSAHGGSMILQYMALIGTATLGVVQAVAYALRTRALPFSPGVYVFPMSVIDARRGHRIQALPMSDLSTLEGPTGSPATFRLVFPRGKSFSFTAKDPAYASAALAEAREQVREAMATNDPSALLGLDPLEQPRFSSPVGPREAMAQSQSPLVKYSWAAAVVLGLALGPVVWHVRNTSSDERMFARASSPEQNDLASYRAYLAHGKNHVDEVSQILLPRVELREAEKDGSVEAIQRYIQSHPSSKIQPEVAASLRAAMAAALERAKSAHTLGALQAFAKAHPDHHMEPQLRQAMHAVYEAGLESYRQQAQPKEKNTVAFVERLFAYAEKKGPKVEVRVRHRPSHTLGKADGHIQHFPTFMGKTSYPSGYFDEKHTLTRNTELARVVIARFGDAFPRELLSFEPGAAPAADEPLPEVTVPTLFLSDETEWPGSTYTNLVPRGVLCGLNYGFDAVFVLPGDPKPLKFRFDTSRVPDQAVFRDAERVPGQPTPEELVYEATTKKAYEAFEAKYFATFFKAPGDK